MLNSVIPREYLYEEMMDLKFNVLYQFNKELYIVFDKSKVKNIDKQINHITENEFIAYCEETKEFYYIRTRCEVSKIKTVENIECIKSINKDQAIENIDILKKKVRESSFKHKKEIQCINLNDDVIIKVLDLEKQFENSRRKLTYTTYCNMELITEINLNLI